MVERAGTVKLIDKDPDEFKLFYSMLHISTMQALAPGTAMVLSRWADEYQADSLKSMCEDVLMMHVEPKSQDALLHALECNLHRRIRQCIESMKKDLAKHINSLAPLAGSGYETLMQEVWDAANAVCAKIERRVVYAAYAYVADAAT